MPQRGMMKLCATLPQHVRGSKTSRFRLRGGPWISVPLLKPPSHNFPDSSASASASFRHGRHARLAERVVFRDVVPALVAQPVLRVSASRIRRRQRGGERGFRSTSRNDENKSNDCPGRQSARYEWLPVRGIGSSSRRDLSWWANFFTGPKSV